MSESIGLQRGTVALTEYNGDWPKLFESEKRELSKIFHGDIEHVGSTSVPGIIAKPIIDILIAVEDIESILDQIEQMKLIGYEPKGEDGVVGREFFVKGPESNRQFYVHVANKGEEYAKEMILFRNRLRDDQEIRTKYQDLKRSLVSSLPDDRGKYTKGKEQFIKEVLSQ